jgi:N-acetylmuramoyl-L-alanine amidase
MGLDSFLGEDETPSSSKSNTDENEETTTTVKEKLKDNEGAFEAKVSFDAVITMELEGQSPENIDKIAKNNRKNVEQLINDELEAFRVVIDPGHEVVKMDTK